MTGRSGGEEVVAVAPASVEAGLRVARVLYASIDALSSSLDVWSLMLSMTTIRAAMTAKLAIAIAAERTAFFVRRDDFRR